MLGLQQRQGWWKGELETNVTMDAEDLLLREFLGLHDDAVIAAAARWIRSKQRDDGTWANFYGGPGDLSTTVEAYLALRLAGDQPDALHMKQASSWILERGGVEATRVFTRIWLALSGQWSWDELPVIPPELIYLPPGSRSTSTTGAAGRGRPSSPSPSSSRSARPARCRSASTSSAPA